ncbi:MAG: ribonuclease P protein component [Bacteroidales bacterium]|nr:ribonuclease P protein component [Bacteroidales bacterium]MDY0215494.1 ribonuclease P protein component [Bacteroidales bacterium]
MLKFSKKERLCSKIVIEEILANKKTIYYQPFKLIYLIHKPIESVSADLNQSIEQTEEAWAKIAIVVPKRLFKRAVDRNALKRIIRESYRLNKEMLIKHLAQNNCHISLFLIYTDKNKADFQFIEPKIKVLLHQLIKRINFESNQKNN